MIPTTTEVFAAFPFLAKLHGLQELPDAGGVAAALEEARTLGADGRDEAAAVFFAFARRAHVLRAWWPALTFDLSAMLVRQRGGRSLHEFRDELRALRLDIAGRRASYDDVRRWFAEHVVQ
jgi:hypothetical protein